jgi:polyhydroxyalkanoate synthesis regulator phasin
MNGEQKEGKMEIVQFFETTIAELEQGPAVQVITLPKSAFTSKNISIGGPNDVAKTLGLEFLTNVPSPSFLSQVIALMIMEKDASTVSVQLNRLLATSPSMMGGMLQGNGMQDPEGRIKALEDRIKALEKRAQMQSQGGLIASLSDIQIFAEHIAFQKMVPVEESPLTSEALATLSISAQIALMAVTGNPLLLVLTPVTIILLAVAKGAGKVVEAAGEGFAEVVKDRIHKSFITKSDTAEDEKRMKDMEERLQKLEAGSNPKG